MYSDLFETMSRHIPAKVYAYSTFKDYYNKNLERFDSYVNDTQNSDKVSKLKEIACFNVAIALWNHVDVPRIVNTYSDYLERRYSEVESEIQLEVQSFLGEFTLPNPTKNQIIEYFDKIREQVSAWVFYHSRKVFSNYKNTDYAFNHIYHLVWHSNGTINCKETARKLTNSVLLNEIEKYYILCTYCMKDDFERLSPCLRTNKIFHVPSFYSYPLVYYWTCYFRNKLNEIPVGVGESINKFMLKWDRVDNWPAKEYFFDQLTSDEQLECAVWLIERYKVKYQKLVLMKLSLAQRLLVYMDKAVDIFLNYVKATITNFPSREIGYIDIMMTWFEIRDVITRDQFGSIFNGLLRVENNEQILMDIWINSCSDFKHYIINYPDNEILRTIIYLCPWSWMKEGLFYAIMRDADTFSKMNITKEEFFFEFCETLIREMKLNILDRVLYSCFPELSKSVQFKQQLVNRGFFNEYFVKLIIVGNTLEQDKLLNSCLPEVSESEKITFKKNLISKTFFETRCKELIMDNELVLLDLLINSCLSDLQERKTFKELLIKKDFFIEHCEKLITEGGSDGVTKLDTVLCWSLIGGEKIAMFKRDLVANSKTLKNQFLNFSSLENFQQSNKLLSKLLSDNFVSEYKRKTLMSVAGINECIKLFDEHMTLLDEIIRDCFPDSNAAAEFRKLIIFLPPIVVKLRNSLMTSNSRFNIVKGYVDRFLVSKEDKKLLKKEIMGDGVAIMTRYFRNSWDLTWISLSMWWLEDEEKVQTFKKTLSLDKIFDEMLKQCIFTKYDNRLTYCRFRDPFGFTTLDRFLNWYFESRYEIKEYKLRRVDSYMMIDTINTLLRKQDDKYLKAIMTWFFQSDAREIDKFQKKNLGRKILKWL